MVDGSHRGFDHSKISAGFTDKHLVDISCPGSSRPSLSEKPPKHIFANGTSGLILHYTGCCGIPVILSLMVYYGISVVKALQGTMVHQ